MEYYSIGYITNPKMPDVTQDDVCLLYTSDAADE